MPEHPFSAPSRAYDGNVASRYRDRCPLDSPGHCSAREHLGFVSRLSQIPKPSHPCHGISRPHTHVRWRSTHCGGTYRSPADECRCDICHGRAYSQHGGPPPTSLIRLDLGSKVRVRQSLHPLGAVVLQQEALDQAVQALARLLRNFVEDGIVKHPVRIFHRGFH